MNTQLLHIAKNDAPELRWGDLPPVSSNPAERSDVKNALGQLVRFATAYNGVYGPLLARSQHRDYARQEWYRQLLRKTHARLDDDAAQDARGKLDAYCTMLLRWITTLVRASSHDGMKVSLFQDGAIGADTPPGNDGLGALQDDLFGRLQDRFADLVADSALGTSKLEDVLDGLNAASPPVDAEGLSAFVEVLFEQCRLGNGAKAQRRFA